MVIKPSTRKFIFLDQSDFNSLRGKVQSGCPPPKGLRLNLGRLPPDDAKDTLLGLLGEVSPCLSKDGQVGGDLGFRQC